MRVLSVGSLYPPQHLGGGYELTWRSAVAHLRSRGDHVRVLATDHRARSPDSAIAEDADVHRELRWYWRDHAFPRLSMRARYATEGHNHAVLDRHLRELRPDVVNWWAMGAMSLSMIEAVRRRGLPAVGVVGDDWMVYGPEVDQWIRAFRRRPAAARAIALATGIPTHVDFDGAARWLFNSRGTRDRAERAGLRPRAAEVVHPGIDPQLFPRAAERSWDWRLLYLGRIEARKGVEVTIRSLSELPRASLAVIGSGEDAYLSSMRSLVSELDLEKRVGFGLRPRNEIPRAYAGADAVLFPAGWEGWGLVPLEAMSVGVPVIASAVGGPAEYLRDGENCLVYAPRDDPRALAAAVRRLAAEPPLRRRLREGGFPTAARFTEAAYNGAIATALDAEVRARR